MMHLAIGFVVFSGLLRADALNERAMPFGDECLESISPSAIILDAACFPEPTSNNSERLEVPGRILAWGSNGLLGAPWKFQEERCNQFYSNLFQTITKAHPVIRLSPHDLFHAHLGRYIHESHKELFMVFHAKEYPSDLEYVKNFYQIEDEQFDSKSNEYEARNFLYLSHAKRLFLVKNQGACVGLFSHEGNNTLSEDKVRATLSGQLLGDINVFSKANIARIKYRFFSGFNEFLGEAESDLEGYYSSKSRLERKLSNITLDNWIAPMKDSYMYFLTGFKQ